MKDKNTCFIIMPITLSEIYLPIYRDKGEHFKHVLDCLIIPSVEKAGFTPVPPVAKGSDVIHAEIIGNLETSDVVLCDMSTLNPNVFFEFGIRTSLNKPVCVVKDNCTSKVPFDTALLNYHEYKYALEPWELPSEIESLSKHIQDSYNKSGGKNSLWKYFGFKSVAIQSKDEFSNKIDNLSAKIGELGFIERQIPATRIAESDIQRELFSNEMQGIVSSGGLRLTGVRWI
jgi:hypothetical protein